jgi:hypothetical protein
LQGLREARDVLIALLRRVRRSGRQPSDSHGAALEVLERRLGYHTHDTAEYAAMARAFLGKVAPPAGTP